MVEISFADQRPAGPALPAVAGPILMGLGQAVLGLGAAGLAFFLLITVLGRAMLWSAMSP